MKLKYSIPLLATLMLLATHHSSAQKDSSGIYKTAEDFQQRKLSYAINCKTEKHKINPNLIFKKEFGAFPVTLVVPYLAYMRQDKRFTDGECISSELFAKLLSSFVDKLITIDPHLHRRISLDEIYPIHTSVLHVSHLVSKWINENIQQPVLIGPDSESEQWVSKVAADANAPYIILKKLRKGDRNVKVSVPQVEKYKESTPVLVDDIISTGNTMIETIGHLKKAGMKPPVCIGIHAVFAARAHDKLIKAGAEKVVTCNTIAHPSNAIFMDELLAQEICKNSFVID